MSLWYPKAKRLPIATREYTMRRVLPLVSACFHITDGLDSRDWLQFAENGSSVHFLIRLENGVAVIYQFMPLEWCAWGNGIISSNNPYMPSWLRSVVARGISPNHATASIEFERDWPFTTELDPRMARAAVELTTWMRDVTPSLIVDRDHFIGHYQIDHERRANCPGGPGGRLFPFDKIIQAVKPGIIIPQPPVPEPAPGYKSRYFPETGYYAGGGFLDEWEKYGLHVMGFPKSNEYHASGFTKQDFENVRLRWKQDDIVRFDAVNREFMDHMLTHK
jgi:N-acetyl-anhydromuramyl-L-alanine amidase AmpD